MSDPLAAFEAEVRTWLSERLPRAGSGEFTSSMALVEEVDPDGEEALIRASQKWQAQLFDAGYAHLKGDKRQRFRHVAAEFHLPDIRPLLVGLHIVAPALENHGSASLQERYLADIMRGDIIACQLFSEPDAGSDLAAVRTRAEKTAGGWNVTGQKIWSSNAHIAQVGEVLVRTDAQAPKHRGLSLFMIDMDQPGVEVRPLRQMTGGASFTEVFLNNAFVPEDNLIGPLNQGWMVAMTSLASERAALGGEFDSIPAHMLERLVHMMRRHDLTDDPVAQIKLAEVAINLEVTAAVRARTADGQLPDALSGSVSKLLVNRTLELATAAAIDIGGSDVVTQTSSVPDSDWSEFILGKPSFRLAGGTDEIQRNLISERHLGLPREPR